MPRLSRLSIVIGAAATVVAATIAVIAVRSGSSKAKPAIATGEPTPLDPFNPFRTGHTLVIPHNGGDGLYPEDTMLAFEKTIALGADVVDADLQLTSDNVVIAFHDPTVNRTTGSTGDVEKMTYAQLSTLDAGWSFSPGDADGKPTGQHPFRGTGVRIPTLESVLQRFPKTLISLDLKDESTAMVHPLCALLVKYDRLNDVFVGSNSDPQIIDFRKECPTVRTSAIMADVYASRDAQATGDKTFVPAVTVDQPPYRSGDRVLVTKDSLAWAHEHGVAILTWVVNDPADMKLLISLGVDGIYTSYPDRLLKLLGRCVDPC